MNDVGYIAAGFIITFAAVVGYLLTLRARIGQAERVRATYLPPVDEGSQ